MNAAPMQRNESFIINLEQGTSHNHNGSGHVHAHSHSHLNIGESSNDETNSVTNGDGTISRGIDADQQANIRSLEIPVNEALRQVIMINAYFSYCRTLRYIYF